MDFTPTGATVLTPMLRDMDGEPTCIFFFFNDTAPTEISPFSLHDALPIYVLGLAIGGSRRNDLDTASRDFGDAVRDRSEEHTSELQSPCNLVCRLLLE